MKPTDKIEKWVKQFRVETDTRKDKVILESLAAAQADSEGEARPYRISRKTIAAGIVSIAAGLVIIMAVQLFRTGTDNERVQPGGMGATATIMTTAAQHQSASEMINVMSLNMAFREGGMNAVDRQFERAMNKMTPKLQERITIDQLLWESGNYEENLERKTL